jgi:7-cyano-7-deazaguanine synthase
MQNKAIVVFSGGLDSTTLAYYVRGIFSLHLVTFDYGQRHRKEIEHAEMIAHELGAEWSLVDVSSLGRLLKGSALTDDIPVPEGHYEALSMVTTIVPNRNAFLLAAAFAIALAEGVERVCIGVHAGDHFIYPDCRPEFLDAFERMESSVNDPSPSLYAPFVQLKKSNIVEIGAALGVPFEKTWSCYKGGEHHCGLCGTCQERIEAFALAGLIDPTVYSCKGKP